ncbi:ABC transporter permease [Rhizobium pusense]|uniref:ABC transporter permease n=1 Tax=Agrobacterium pusense TaxID=648995 RepID=UPI001FCDC913|nr:ABC transporter permease [Agrobacterium pusense]MCJ2877576.1 ABC transporter permease [Agrobacterium pusense]
MLAYLLRRLTLVVPTIFVALIVVFLLLRLIPGDPALMQVGDLNDLSALEEARRNLGLDRSIPEQFLIWMGDVLRGNLGTSIKSGEPVIDMILRSFPVTAQVVLLATFLASCVALPGGLLAAWRQNSRFDIAVVAFAALCLSVPGFWLALLLLTLFGVILGWLPTVGYVSIADDPGRGLLYLIMPVLALTMNELAALTRMSRSSTIDVMRLEFVTNARAKGLPQRTVMWKHVFPNAFAPTLTVIGLLLGHLLSGVVVIETMFSLPGIGRLMVNGIFMRDYPVVQGVLLFSVFLTISINVIIDLLYPVFDPRVRL